MQLKIPPLLLYTALSATATPLLQNTVLTVSNQSQSHILLSGNLSNPILGGRNVNQGFYIPDHELESGATRTYRLKTSGIDIGSLYHKAAPEP